jgi:glycosyltransferase involved in cell wall biosynthesis
VTLDTPQPVALETELAAFPATERNAVGAFLAAHALGGGAPVAVVIAAYNEEPTVVSVIEDIPAEIAGLRTEVIVVNDGSADATATLAAGAGALVCDLSTNVGHGAALKLGYWMARKRGARIIATIDADAQYLPQELDRVVEPIAAGHADFVNGSRRLGNELTTDPMRHAGVIFFGALMSLLIGQRITDPASGIRGFRVEVPATVTLKQAQYQTSELLIGTAMAGFRIIEVPTTMRDRPVGATETKKGPNLLYGMRFARAVLGTWLRERRARVSDRSAARTRLTSEKIQ